jgi:hypothetical protein
MGFKGFLTRLFGQSRKTADQELLAALLSIQQKRIEADSEIEKLDRELRLKSRQLELDNLEKTAAEKRKDDENRVRLRALRQQQAEHAREVKKQKASAPAPSTTGRFAGCTVCADPSSPRLSAHEIQWHAAGHPGALQ